MCNAFTRDCGYDNFKFTFIGDVYCRNTECSGKICLHPKTFQSPGRSDYLCPQCASVCQVRNIPLEDQRGPFLVVSPRGWNFWRKSIVISRYYWKCLLSWQVLFQQRQKPIFWRLCNNSEFYFWLWRAWSLVVCSQSSFYVTRAGKDYKSRQKTLFLCYKRWHFHSTNNCSLMSHFNQLEIEGKIVCGQHGTRVYWRCGLSNI